MVCVITHTVDAIFISAKQFISALCVQHSTVQLLQCKTSFLLQLWPRHHRDELSDYSATFMESDGIMNMSYKSAVLKKSSSKLLNSDIPLMQHLKL